MAKTSSKHISTTVVMQRNFYRDQYRKLVFMTGFITLTNIICAFIIAFLLLEHPGKELIQADEVNRPSSNLSATDFDITPQIPVSRPNMKQMEVTQWLLNAIVNSFTYSLQTYTTHLESNQKYYTNTAWRQYTSILNNMVRFDQYKKSEVLISILDLQHGGAPTLYENGVVDGVYTWVYEYPVMVKFAGSVEEPGQSMTLHITVSRTSMKNDPNGIKISNIEAFNVKRLAGVATATNVVT